MCGIFGFDKRTNATEFMTPALAIYMHERGRQSWGVTDGRQVHKEPSDIIDSFEEKFYSPAIYHTRAASVGEVTQGNAHPFTSVVGDLRVVGVHNGHISNHSELDTRYKRNFSVDSMHIFQHLAERKDVSELTGWGAVVWAETQICKPEAPPQIFMSRFNTQDLHVVKLDTKEGELVWASTKSAIEAAMQLAGLRPKYFYKIEERVKYLIGPDGRLHNEGPLKWSQGMSGTSSSACGYDMRGRAAFSNAGRSTFTGWVCAMPHCAKTIASMEDLICKHCFDAKMEEFFMGDAETAMVTV